MATERVPQPRDPAPDRPVVELLVHGVGGATPQQMLGDTRTIRITGDDTASVHRRTDDAEDRPWDAERPLREAYSWSNLTSGNGARALWLLLLPFMIVNVAHWMRPAARGHARTHRTYDILVRLIALSLTVLLICGACAVALDLVAWQCAAAPECAGQTSWFGFLSDGGWWSQPGRVLALAALLPVILTTLLWWLSHRTWSTYESAYPPVRDRTDDGERAVLTLPGFWYGRGLVSRLRAGHTAAGLLTVCAALQAATWEYDRGAHGSAVLELSGWLLAAALLATAGAAISLVTRHGRSELEVDHPPSPPIVTALPLAAAGLLVLTVLHSGWDRPQWETVGHHPGTVVFPALAVLQGALITGLALAARRLYRATPADGCTVLRGLGGPAVAMLACGLGGVLTGGAAQRFADWLEPDSGESSLPGPPVLLSWQAAIIPALLCVLLVLAALALWRVLRERRRHAPGVPGDYPGEQVQPHSTRSAQVAGAVARARLTDSAPLVVGVLAVAALVLATGAVAAAWRSGGTPVEATESAPALIAGFAELSQTIGSWLMGFGALVLIAMGRRAYRDPAARRTVGILWDVGTFWPRAAHPLAPPCYAERAVPDLSWRIGTWIDRTGGRVVVSGHSQGSVLAAAAVWQLDRPTRSHVALLTHGSPLARLYGRWFPMYFGPRALGLLHRDMPCWRNLWRATDPIGGPVDVPDSSLPDGAGPDAGALAGDPAGELLPVDRGPLLDPLHYGRNLHCPLPEPLLGHSDYAADPAYQEERHGLYRRLCRGRASAPPPRTAEPARPAGPPVALGQPVTLQAPGPSDREAPPAADGDGPGEPERPAAPGG
jgi:hypothetical protein